jgi:hypothetical protein
LFTKTGVGFLSRGNVSTSTLFPRSLLPSHPPAWYIIRTNPCHRVSNTVRLANRFIFLSRYCRSFWGRASKEYALASSDIVCGGMALTEYTLACRSCRRSFSSLNLPSKISPAQLASSTVPSIIHVVSKYVFSGSITRPDVQNILVKLSLTLSNEKGCCSSTSRYQLVCLVFHATTISFAVDILLLRRPISHVQSLIN